MNTLFDKENIGNNTLRAVWVQYGATERVSESELKELKSVNWELKTKGSEVKLKHVHGKFLSYNPITNVVYLELQNEK